MKVTILIAMLVFCFSAPAVFCQRTFPIQIRVSSGEDTAAEDELSALISQEFKSLPDVTIIPDGSNARYRLDVKLLKFQNKARDYNKFLAIYQLLDTSECGGEKHLDIQVSGIYITEEYDPKKLAKYVVRGVNDDVLDRLRKTTK